MREIRTLRAMWRALETELRQLLNGHEEGNLGYKPRRNLRATAPALDPTGIATGIGPLRAEQERGAMRVLSGVIEETQRTVATSAAT